MVQREPAPSALLLGTSVASALHLLTGSSGRVHSGVPWRCILRISFSHNSILSSHGGLALCRRAVLTAGITTIGCPTAWLLPGTTATKLRPKPRMPRALKSLLSYAERPSSTCRFDLLLPCTCHLPTGGDSSTRTPATRKSWLSGSSQCHSSCPTRSVPYRVAVVMLMSNKAEEVQFTQAGCTSHKQQ